MNPGLEMRKQSQMHTVQGLVRALLAALSVLATVSQAQVPFGLVTGTSTRDGAGQPWSYLAWFGPELEAPGQVFAIYSKPGEAAAPGEFTRKSVLMRQTDVPTIAALLARGENLGFSAALLNETLDGYFSSLFPPGQVLTLPQKVSTAIAGASPDQAVTLNFLGRQHPGLNLCLGLGFAEPIGVGAIVTYELRQFDPAANQDLGVAGRVTITEGVPVVMPAPGAPRVVRERRPDGRLSSVNDLIVPLRWDVPDALRQLPGLHQGFHVYRMTKPYALANGYDANLPRTSTLLALLQSNPNEVIRVTSIPITPDLAQPPSTVFITDDNGFSQGRPRFAHRAEYYYFVTATDLLARDGIVSAGTLAMVCIALPPDPPADVRVENDYQYPGGGAKEGEQRLKVTWQQASNTGEQKIVRYHVYRWRSIEEIKLLANAVPFDISAAGHRAGVIEHVPGSLSAQFIDNGPEAPSAKKPDDLGATYFYTLRSEDDCPVEPNYSPHTAPVWGVLRDREGPPPPGGGVAGVCYRPEVEFRSIEFAPLAIPDPGNLQFRFICTRDSAALEWADFSLFPADPRTGCNALFTARVAFNEETGSAELDVALPAQQPLPRVAWCYVGSIDGQESGPALGSFDPPDGTRRVVSQFTARYAELPATENDPCPHIAQLPGTDSRRPIRIRIQLTPGTKEWKLYRRIGDGEPSLVAQGLKDFNPAAPDFEMDDIELPFATSQVCYFAQCFDQHGNPSPMVPIGCKEVPNPPVPALLPITAAGSVDRPEMKLQWFCHPAGVERFDVQVAEERGKPSLFLEKASLIAKFKPVERAIQVEGTALKALFAAGFHTARVGGELGDGPLFAMTSQTQPGRQYTVQVRSITPTGLKSPWSQPAVFKWTHLSAKTEPPQPGVEEPCLPWPARGLPPIHPNANLELVARSFIDLNHPTLGTRYPAGVRIAVAPAPGRIQSIAVGRFSGAGISPLLVRRQDQNQADFPFVLYRYQVPNTAYPRVSGDLVQISPLHEFLNLEFVVDGSAMAVDPFFARVPEDATFRGGGRWDGIYALDTHPVLSAAKYVYLVVCFHYNGELDQIIPTNPITMPEFNF